MFLKENKRILILGSRGRLGCYLKNYLQDLFEVFLDEPNVDLSNIKNLENLIERCQPDIILNSIALTNVNHCEKNVLDAFKSNTEIVKNITQIIEKKKLNIFLVQISTDQIYSGIGPHKENENCKPINVYSLTKFFGEFYATQVDSLILRTNFFDFYKKPKHFSFINEIYSNLTNNKSIFGYQDIFFNPVHISSLAELIKSVIVNPKIGIFNYGSKNGLSKFEFTKKIVEKFGYDSNFVIQSNSDNFKSTIRPKDMRMNTLKIKNKLKMNINSIDTEIEKIAI